MIRVSVLYPNKEELSFDWSYYMGSHMPMVSQKLGSALKSVCVEQGVSGGMPGAAPVYVALAHLGFDSLEAFQAAFIPHATEIMADIPNYTAIVPILQINKVMSDS